MHLILEFLTTHPCITNYNTGHARPTHLRFKQINTPFNVQLAIFIQ